MGFLFRFCWIATFLGYCLLMSVASASQDTFHEGWESAQFGSFAPTSEPLTLIRGDAGTWLMGDTVSTDPSCGQVLNRASIIPWGGGRALRLDSVASNSGCADNLWLDILEAPPFGINPGFGVALSQDTVISFQETGSLINPMPNRPQCKVPPFCGDKIELFVQDNHGNIIVYVMQRADTATPQTVGGVYREIFLDPNAASYTRNLFADFSTLAAFNPNNAEVKHIEVEITSPGFAIFDNLTLSSSGTPIPSVTLTASPIMVNYQGSSTLNWSSTNATTCSATTSDGWAGAVPLSGSVAVIPKAVTTYTLTCTGNGGTVSKSVTVQVTESSADCLFNWAETNYSNLFSPSGAVSQFSSPYTYRYYSATNTYLGVSSADDHVYYLGADGVLQDVDSLSYWLPIAGCQ